MRTAIPLKQHQFHDLAAHFLALDAVDRRLRFGWVISDAELVTYVESATRVPGDVFVVAAPASEIAGAACLDFYGGSADLGLSVSGWARRRGIGRCLLERAALHAGVRGVRTMFVCSLNFNGPLRRLALSLGMRVALAPEGGLTRLELAPVDDDGSDDVHASVMTLADRSLRFGWGAAGAGARSTIDHRQTPVT
jgi:GNAT superfamily N-acetyltransferase